jgi:predicted ArsR family transcriptional regulator
LRDDATILIDTPERLRALADPLRQRLLAAFASEPATVKAVAAQLGEPVTKLYRHVSLLVDAGFLYVVEEQRKRGAIERTFGAAGHRFVVAPESAPGMDNGDLARAALEELLAKRYSSGGMDRLHLMRTRLRMTPAALRRFENALRDLLEDHASEDGVETDLLVIAAPEGT